MFSGLSSREAKQRRRRRREEVPSVVECGNGDKVVSRKKKKKRYFRRGEIAAMEKKTVFEERAPSTLQEAKVAAATQVGGTSALSGTRDEDAGDMPFLPKHEVIRRLRASLQPCHAIWRKRC